MVGCGIYYKIWNGFCVPLGSGSGIWIQCVVCRCRPLESRVFLENDGEVVSHLEVLDRLRGGQCLVRDGPLVDLERSARVE